LQQGEEREIQPVQKSWSMLLCKLGISSQCLWR